jgi:hypothetical protein
MEQAVSFIPAIPALPDSERAEPIADWFVRTVTPRYSPGPQRDQGGRPTEETREFGNHVAGVAGADRLTA